MESSLPIAQIDFSRPTTSTEEEGNRNKGNEEAFSSDQLACVAGGSRCAAKRRIFREREVDSSPFFSRPARLFAHAFGTEVRAGTPLPPATQATDQSAIAVTESEEIEPKTVKDAECQTIEFDYMFQTSRYQAPNKDFF